MGLSSVVFICTIDQQVRLFSFSRTLLFETLIQVGQRKEANQLLESLVAGPARHVPAQMVRLLVKAGGAGLATSDRYISWALGVSSTQDKDSLPVAGGPKSASSEGNKKEGNVQMSGQLAQKLVELGLLPASKIAKLIASDKEAGEHLDEIVKILKMITTREDIIGTQNSGSFGEAGGAATIQLASDEGDTHDYTPDARFQLLLTLGRVSLDRRVSSVCQVCVRAAERILGQEQLTDRISAKYSLEFLSVELKTHMESFAFDDRREQIVEALHFDDTGEFTENIIHMYNSFQLRAKLYEIPQTPEDNARQILEQIRSVNLEDFCTHKLSELFHTRVDSFATTYDDKNGAGSANQRGEFLRRLLSHAGELLAPGVFQKSLELEEAMSTEIPINRTTDRSQGVSVPCGPERLRDETVQMLADRVRLWSDCTDNVGSDQARNVISEADNRGTTKERLLLWSDLAQAARRFRLWGLCALACRFCLLYDDDTRWEEVLNKIPKAGLGQAKVPPEPAASQKTAKKNVVLVKPEVEFPMLSVLNRYHFPSSDPSSMVGFVNALRQAFRSPPILTHYELVLMKALAQTNCLYAEALCVLLRNQPYKAAIGSCVSPKKIETETPTSTGVAGAEVADRNLDRDLCEKAILENTAKFGQNPISPELYADIAIVLAHGLLQPWLPKSDLLGVRKQTSQASSNPTKQTSKPASKSPSARNKLSAGKTASSDGVASTKQAIEWLVSAASIVDLAGSQPQDDLFNSSTTPTKFEVERSPPYHISLNCRSRLIHTWLVAQQMLPGVPTCRNQFPGDQTIDPNTLTEGKPSAARTDTVNTDGTQMTRALLAVHAIWLSQQQAIMEAWPNTVAKILGHPVLPVKRTSGPNKPTALPGFKDAPSLSEAITLMKSAFLLPTLSSEVSRIGDQEKTAQKESNSGRASPELQQTYQHRRLPPLDRQTELSLWSHLAQCAIVSEQYTTAVEVTELANLENELFHEEPCSQALSLAACQLLNSRGLAVLGIAIQLRIQKGIGSKSSTAAAAAAGPPQSQSSKPKRPPNANIQVESVRTLGDDSSIYTQAGCTIESSLFAAAEEAFYKATEFAVKYKRYDATLMAAKHYWALCNCPELALASDVTNMLRKIPTVCGHVKQLLHWLSQCLDSHQKSYLNELIRDKDRNETNDGQPETEGKMETGVLRKSNENGEENSKFEVTSLFDATPVSRPTLAQFEEDLRLRVEMYTALFNVKSADGDHSGGLSLLAEAIHRFPRTKHRMPLFHLLVITKAKLGQSVVMEMQKFGNQLQAVQAEMWRELAHISLTPEDQFNAYRQAVAVLKDQDSKSLKAEILFELAQWLMVNKFEINQCLTLAEHGIDLLLDFPNHPIPEIDEPSQPAKDAHTKSERELKGKGKVTEPKVPTSVNENTCVVSSDQISSCFDVARLDSLMRGFTLMAELYKNAGEACSDPTRWKDYIILSLRCVKQIWKKPPPIVDKRGDKNQGSGRSGGGKSNLGAEPSPGRNTVRSSMESLPQNAREWAVYEVPDDVIRTWDNVYYQYESVSTHAHVPAPPPPSPQRPSAKPKSVGTNAARSVAPNLGDFVTRQINPLTIKCPFVTVSCLTNLANMLTENGLTNHALPVLVLEECLTRKFATGTSSLPTRYFASNQLVRLSLLVRQTADPTSSHSDPIVQSWLELGDRLARLSLGSLARKYLEAASRFCRGIKQQKDLLVAQSRLAIAEGQYKLARNLLGQAVILDPEDEDFWFTCFLLRLETLSNDPRLAARKFLSNAKQDGTVFANHHGIRVALEEIQQACCQLQQRCDHWAGRKGWYNLAQGLLMSIKGQIESRMDEAMYYSKILSHTSESDEEELDNPVHLLSCTEGAVRSFSEAVKFFSSVGNHRGALRLGWLPLAAYWRRTLEAQTDDLVVKLRSSIIHPAVGCPAFQMALSSARECVKQAKNLVNQVEALNSTNEIEGCSLPVHRDLAEANLNYVAIILAIMRAELAYERAKFKADQSQDPLKYAVDMYVKGGSDDGPEAVDQLANQYKLHKEAIRLWFGTMKTAFDKVTSVLSDTFLLSENLTLLKTKCLLLMGRTLMLHTFLQMPDSPDSWDSSGPRYQTQLEQFQRYLNAHFDDDQKENKPQASDPLLGSRWKTREDIIRDLKRHDATTELQAQAVVLLLTALKSSAVHGYVSLAKAATESLLQIIGGWHESAAAITQSLIYGLQSYGASCRLRTHLSLVALAHSSQSICGKNCLEEATQGTYYQTKIVLNRAEALLRQMIWLSPYSASTDETISAAWGLSSSGQTISYVDALNRALGMRSLSARGRFLTQGGLEAGPDDHSPETNPWLLKAWEMLRTCSKEWKMTDVDANVVFEPTKSLTTALNSLPDPSSQIIRGWNTLLMEHSADLSCIYCSTSEDVFTSDGRPKSTSQQPTASKTQGNADFLSDGLYDHIHKPKEQFPEWPSLAELVGKVAAACQSDLPSMEGSSRSVVGRRSLSLNSDPPRNCHKLVRRIHERAEFANGGIVLLLDSWINEMPVEAMLTNELLCKLSSDQTDSTPPESFSVTPKTPNQSGKVSQNSRRNQTAKFSCTWFARQFSIQLLVSQISGDSLDQTEDVQTERTVSRNQAKKNESRGPHLSPRHPLLRETEGKFSVNAEHQSTPGTIRVIPSAVRYIVDPFADSASLSNQVGGVSPGLEKSFQRNGSSPTSTSVPSPLGAHFQTLLRMSSSASPSLTSHWLGLTGNSNPGYAPSEDELYAILNEGASGLIAYITEGILEYFTPPHLSSLSLSKCYLVAIFDRMHTPSSLLRQGIKSTRKTLLEQELEKPLSAATLFSLAGCRSVVLPQWTGSILSVQMQMKTLFREMLNELKPLGKSILLTQFQELNRELRQQLEEMRNSPKSPLPDPLSERSCKPVEYVASENPELAIEQEQALNFPVQPFNLVLYGLPNISF
ncbi:unnamed protein product [Calicophoron daubneyi]|uniref:Uncharacterized protein n=1 Tax=Calicophoron daubneyi TaxID=300641 RepID=A0AAV2TQ20_CALDB